MKEFSLYLDTSYYLTVGLLDNTLNWVAFDLYQDTKSASKIHAAIQKVLNQKLLLPQDLKQVFTCFGPGSYTGIRYAYIVGQMYAQAGIPLRSFFHHELPSSLNIDKGTFIANAFKSEYFLYQWNNGQVQTKFIPHQSLSEKDIQEENVYILEGTKLPPHLSLNITSTNEFIIKQTESVFTKIQSDVRQREIFYYRDNDKEFTIPKS
jgi:tRNA A37 threonylcarbamoyladenosine modification protein TsaB